MTSARICVVQYEMKTISSFDDFAAQCRYFADVAAGYKADFLLYPEMLANQLLSMAPGKTPQDAIRFLTEHTSRFVTLFKELATSRRLNIIAGSHFTIEGASAFNIAHFFKRDGTMSKQYKLHATPGERNAWGIEPGHEVAVFDTDKGKIAIQICYDIEFPEGTRLAVEQGARIVFVPFCTDDRQGFLRVRYCAQARCIENQIYVATAGIVGNLRGVGEMDVHYAQSAILTPSDFGFARDGIAAECPPNIEAIAVADVNLDHLEHARKAGTVLNWRDRRTDLYEVKLLRPKGTAARPGS